MPKPYPIAAVPRQTLLSLDGWVVVLALALAAAVRFGLLRAVPW